MKFTFANISIAACLFLSVAEAQDSGGASAASAQDSTPVSGQLAASGIPVALGVAVATVGSAAAIATGDPTLLEDGVELGAGIAELGFMPSGPLVVSDEVIVSAPPAPNVPYEDQSQASPVPGKPE